MKLKVALKLCASIFVHAKIHDVEVNPWWWAEQATSLVMMHGQSKAAVLWSRRRMLGYKHVCKQLYYLKKKLNTRIGNVS